MSNESPDLTTLDREALARMVTELQQKVAQMDKLYVHPDPSVPNPCTICGFHIYGSYTGDGDGSMKNGGRFAHPECYEKRRLEAERDKAMRALESLTPGGSEFVGDVDACVAHIRARQSSMLESIKRQVRLRAGLANERDDLQASLAWLVNAVIEDHEIVATPNKEAWLSRAKECGENWRRNLAEMQESAATWRELAESAEAQLAAARAEVERLTSELAEAERMFTFAANKGNRHLESLRKARADNACLRAVLAQVGEAVKARAVEIASYANGREDAGSYIAAEIESIDIAAIGAASAPDNAISQAPANSDTLAALTERILNLKSYLDNAPNIELDASNVRALVDNLAAIVAPGAETTNALRSDPTRPCCPECNEEKNLAYMQTNAEAEEWLCKNCRHHFQFKPPAEE